MLYRLIAFAVAQSLLLSACGKLDGAGRRSAESRYPGTTLAVTGCIDRNRTAALDREFIAAQCRQRQQFLIPHFNRGHDEPPSGIRDVTDGELFDVKVKYSDIGQEFDVSFRNLSEIYVITEFTLGINRSGVTTGKYNDDFRLTKKIPGTWIQPGETQAFKVENRQDVIKGDADLQERRLDVPVDQDFVVTVVDVFGVHKRLP